MEPQAKYSKHIMVCVRERDANSPKGSCGRCGGDQIRKRFADLLKEHGLKGEMRASKTECLDACELGAVVVIYPDDLWYTGVQLDDVDKIFAASVLQDGFYAPRLATAETWKYLDDIRAGKAEKPLNPAFETQTQRDRPNDYSVRKYDKYPAKDKSSKKNKKDKKKYDSY